MREDDLRQLIRQADAAAGAPPPPPDDLAQRVMREAARRRMRLRGVMSAAAAIVLAGGYWTLLHDDAVEPAPVPAPIFVANNGDGADLLGLKMEIHWAARDLTLQQKALERTALLLEQQERIAKLKQTPMPDTVANVNREADKAAGEIVSQADRLCRRMKSCESAAVKYRRVVNLFPDSRWAQVARQRLDEIEHKGDV